METNTSWKSEDELIFQKFLKAGREIIPQFELTEIDKEIYLRAYKYFTKEKAFEDYHPSYSLKKGLIVIGPYGVGKTLMFQVLNKIVKREIRDEDFGIFRSYEIAVNYSKEGPKIIKLNGDDCFHEQNGQKVKTKPKNRLYDDLGSEQRFSSFFGSKINVMEVILMKRYDLFIETGMKTFITTNLTGDKIEKMYGERIRSRLRQMTNAIYYPGVDRRR